MKAHWDTLYRTTEPNENSWYQEIPRRSLDFIGIARIPKDAAILDVGGGDSTLVDHLLMADFSDLTVLDVAPQALARAQTRLGEASRKVQWIASDVLEFRPARRFALWHDRAVFHFLVDDAARVRYRSVLEQALGHDGHVILATFGPEGPQQCSGLVVQRYSPEALSEFLGPAFVLVRQAVENHTTPRGATQQFAYGLWKQRQAG